MAANGAVPQVPPPAGPPPAPVSRQEFDAEVRQAIQSERWLPVKALFALALVAAVLAIHVIFFA
jgi:hypothetical protein